MSSQHNFTYRAAARISNDKGIDVPLTIDVGLPNRFPMLVGQSVVALCFAVVSMLGTARAQPVDSTEYIYPTEVRIPRVIDSGPLNNNSERRRVLFEDTIENPDAAWITAYFSAIDLQPGSIVRITSLRDNQTQEFDAPMAKMWGNRSAYFNGSRIRIEVEAAPYTENNRIALEAVGVQLTGGDNCGPPCPAVGPDTRVPSSEDWSGRWLGGGCTMSMYNENGCFVTAGHCVAVSYTTVIGFRNPLAEDCEMMNPEVLDQFPVIYTFRDLSGGFCVPDWRVGKLGLNSAGQSHYQRYGVYKPIAGGPPSVNGSIDLFGFGKSEVPHLTGVQQHTSATVTNIGPLSFVATGGTVAVGTSGGGWLFNDAIVGINTCCGIIASRIDQPDFVVARRQMCPQTVHVPWDQPFCLNQTTVNVPITVCNSSGYPDSYQLSFASVPAGPGCAVNGPTNFTPVGSSIIGPLQNGECLTLQIVISRPPGLTDNDLTACYEVTATSLNTGIAVTDRGSVQDKRNVCAVFRLAGNNGGPVAIPVDDVQQFRLSVQNDRVPSGILDYRIEAFDPKMELSGAISVDGNYVGVPSTGSAKIPMGSTGEIDFTLSYRWLEPFDISDIVISTDVDRDGKYEPLTSIGVRSVEPSTGVDSDPISLSLSSTLRLLPNPTRESTTIAFTLRDTGPVTLNVHDLTGQLVRTLISGPLASGDHSIVWNGNDDAGRSVEGGTYIAELIARDEHQSIKILRLP